MFYDKIINMTAPGRTTETKGPILFKNFPLSSCTLLLQRSFEHRNWNEETMKKFAGDPTLDAITNLMKVDQKIPLNVILEAYADPQNHFYEQYGVRPEYLPAKRAAGLAVILAKHEDYGDVGKRLYDFASGAETREQFRHYFRVALADDIKTSDRKVSEIDARLTRSDLNATVRSRNQEESEYWGRQLEILNEVRDHVKESASAGEKLPLT